MAVIGALGGLTALAQTVENISEVFAGNAAAREAADAEFRAEILRSYAAEFTHSGSTGFDRAINRLNRLPRPLMALPVIGKFAFAMIDPVAFAARMTGLAAIPEPLWWLLGAVVSFYFGAREMYYARIPDTPPQRSARRWWSFGQSGIRENPALEEWRAD